MKKQKIEIIVTSVLVFFLVLVLFGNTKNKKGVRRRPVANLVKKIVADMHGTAKQPAAAPAAARRAVVTQERDPFQFGEVKTVTAGGLVLNGIVWDEKAPSAIVNNTVVKVGDEVDGSKIVEIQKERVIFFKDGQNYELNIETINAQ